MHKVCILNGKIRRLYCIGFNKPGLSYKSGLNKVVGNISPPSPYLFNRYVGGRGVHFEGKVEGQQYESILGRFPRQALVFSTSISWPIELSPGKLFNEVVHL